jgi:hypothetical protein
MTKQDLIDFLIKFAPLPYKEKPEWEKHWRVKMSRMPKNVLQDKADALNA